MLKRNVLFYIILALIFIISGCSSLIDTTLPDQPEIEDFNVQGQIGESFIDEENKKIIVKVKEEVDLTNLTPTIITTEDTVISPDPSEGQDFTEPVTYTLTKTNDELSAEWQVFVYSSASDYPEPENSEKFPDATEYGATEYEDIDESIINKIVTSSEVGNSINLMLKEDGGMFLTASESPHWVIIEFDTKRTIKGVKLLHNDDPKFTTVNYNIQSWHEGYWYNRVEVKNNSDIETIYDFVEPIETKKIALYVTQATPPEGDDKLRLCQMEINFE